LAYGAVSAIRIYHRGADGLAEGLNMVAEWLASLLIAGLGGVVILGLTGAVIVRGILRKREGRDDEA